MLYSGTCLVKRSSDSLVLSTITAPCLVGLHDIYHEKSDVLIHAVSDIEYGITKAKDFFNFVDENHLWKEISYMLMISTTRFSEYQKETVGISNYELICNLLMSLNNESFEIRATTSALEYIQERSSLSRSGIMKILASLRDGGYIVIKKGLLIKINKLPKGF
ncbi:MULTISPECIES: helix-turn-helix domain-containing protein [unclassified Enterobacter cloacae complex]|uniref:helix-turn-helix domain-containing protein n=1 Tax=unclassified Enterobacter cloacae complex TaxID=2757714 RepID=UPI00187249D1|nr:MULTISPECIES: helix-turn-helix domain-containing protein [unclassified Enterobacter cloacae complex]MBE4810073.1 helix-turn-helix domain-containing protein [Enterobacter cloacae complex sp. P44RS]MBE4827943.1 helix-turn-helix domain-containing protein [Enterobacter cloacae complex sp. P42RS]MBE4836249.1 helix-turn-helix domain-containing protein [Enterobacter cloacae complex sp. P46RS]MBE4839850.1 helix-turn-helix domain-containing protein [Enterobacter cloacae complex sp. P42C]